MSKQRVGDFVIEPRHIRAVEGGFEISFATLIMTSSLIVTGAALDYSMVASALFISFGLIEIGFLLYRYLTRYNLVRVHLADGRILRIPCLSVQHCRETARRLRSLLG